MKEPRAGEERTGSEFTDSLKKGLLIGAVLLVLIVPPLRMYQAAKAPPQPPPAVTQAPAAPRARVEAPVEPSLRMANFAGERPSAAARHVANWAVFTSNHGRHAFVIVDKKDARVYVFAPDGKLKESAPALLGAARGDDSFPGIGDKPLNQVRPEEKTTPAGRFIAEPGRNTNNEDIVWVDYDAAVSMHRIRPNVAAERRLERLASRVVEDNRISFGCINLPVTFYEEVLSPAVQKYGAVVYVLPDVKTPQQVFGSFDVRDPAQVAAWKKGLALQAVKGPARSNGVQKVAMQAS
ncbi:hypothetical protein WG902_13985 [Ramlibacter sp. PS3R-8]|uniref:hypothetical protein n=1 Tax=Ramlibacter sp. PS3R-8 TaxID=3133437 RepID=UPI0030A1366F